MIVFDLDDTLIDTQGSVMPPLLRWILQEIQRQGHIFAHFEKALDHWYKLNQYARSAGKGFAEFAQMYHIPEPLCQFALQSLYHHPVFTPQVSPMEGSLDILEELSSEHTLALVSRGEASIQSKKMELAGIDTDWFDHLYFDPKACKKQFYSKILFKEKKRAQNALVCGDRIEADLSPAKQLGMKTVHIRSGRGLGNTGFKTHVDYTIVYLSELRNILYRLRDEAL